MQRLSTIFEFIGIFKDEEGKTSPPLTLQRTDYLPSFAGVTWEGENPELSFSKEQQLRFKRSRIDVIIMKKESDPTAKYELFQRLNTGGTKLSDQEVRNCLMIMTNKSFYEFIIGLSKKEAFVNCLPISDRRTDEQYHVELLLRMLIPEYIDWDCIGQYSDFAQLLDKETMRICELDLDYASIEKRFAGTFSILYGLFEDNAFKKYNGTKHSGPVMAAAYQPIATGVYHNIDAILEKEDRGNWLKAKVQAIYSTEEFIKNTTPGVRSIPRFKELSQFGIEYFKP